MVHGVCGSHIGDVTPTTDGQLKRRQGVAVILPIAAEAVGRIDAIFEVEHAADGTILYGVAFTGACDRLATGGKRPPRRARRQMMLVMVAAEVKAREQ